MSATRSIITSITAARCRQSFLPVFGLTARASAMRCQQLDGEDATGAERAAFRLMNEFLGLMLDPFVYGRDGGHDGPGALGFAPDQQKSLPPDIALAYADALKAPPPTFAQRWTAWGAGFGGSSHRQRRSRRRLQQRHRQHLRLCRRHGLSLLARHGSGLCPGRRRHQLGSCECARHRAQRCGAGRRPRRHPWGPVYLAGRVGVRQ